MDAAALAYKTLNNETIEHYNESLSSDQFEELQKQFKQVKNKIQDFIVRFMFFETQCFNDRSVIAARMSTVLRGIDMENDNIASKFWQVLIYNIYYMAYYGSVLYLELLVQDTCFSCLSIN